MKSLILLFVSISILGYSTKALDDIINSTKTDSEKIKAVLLLDKELKQDIKRIDSFKKQYITKYKKIAVSTMKDKTKTNYDKMKAWEEFAIIAESTKHAKSGKRMAYKYSQKAFKDLSRKLKKEELEAERDYNKIVGILDKILSLQITKKQKAKFQKRRDIYAKKLENGHRKETHLNASQPMTVPVVAEQQRPKEKKEKKTDKNATTVPDVTVQHHPKEKEKKKSSVSHKHALSGKHIESFRALVYNSQTTKLTTLDISNYVGKDALSKKKLVILTFYANYCKPCKKELPFLNKLYKKYKNKGLMVIAVNTDKDKDEIKEVKQFIKNNNLQFPVLKDSYNIISRRYSIESFPTMFLINGKGKILKATIGYDDNEGKLENDIISLLK